MLVAGEMIRKRGFFFCLCMWICTFTCALRTEADVSSRQNNVQQGKHISKKIEASVLGKSSQVWIEALGSRERDVVC